MPRLVINPGTNSAWEVQLKQGINKLGRSFDNDFKLEHSSVSGTHCEIVVENGNALLKDLNSTNGTFVNRSPVKEARLQPGQTIHLGGVELLYAGDAPITATVGATEVIPRPAAPAPAPPAPRLSISASRPAPPAAEPPPPPTVTHTETALAPPSAAGMPTFSGRGNCKFHPKTPGRYHCAKCQLFFCELCVTSRTVGETAHKYCRKCGSELNPVKVTIQREVVKGFFPRLPGAFIYPFKGSGVLVLIVATLLFAGLDVMSAGLFGLLMRMAALGYLFSYMQNIIHSTAAEDDEMASLPAMDGLFSAFFTLAGVVLISFGIPIGMAVAKMFFDVEGLSVPFMLGLTFVGCFYFPMAFLAVAMKDTALAANPAVVIPAILKAPLEYLVTALFLAGVFGLRFLGSIMSSAATSVGFATRDMSVLFMTFGIRMFWAFASVYLLTVAMRVLGLLYLTKKEKFGWFSR